MMHSDRLSLRQRLVLWLLPPILLLMLLWIWATYRIVLHFTGLAYDRALEDTVQTLAGQVQVRDGMTSINLPPAAQQMLEFDPVDVVFYSVEDNQGQFLVGNNVLPPSPSAALDQTGTIFFDGLVDGQAVRVAEYTLPDDLYGNPHFVRVAETLRKREIVAREALAVILVPQLLFLASVVLLVWYGIGRGIAPLQKIRDAIARRTHEDLSPLDQSGLPAEVHEQVAVINDLMSRLGRTIVAQKRFIADATHQLRTPITVLRTQTELALRARDQQELQALVGSMDAATQRLSRLATQLLNLSRAEAGREGSAVFTEVDFTSLVEDVVAALVPAAMARDIDIRLELARDLPPVSGDPQLLQEMLSNLVDNGIRYTPEGGRIQVKVSQDAGHVAVAIVDNGPGLPLEERSKVLQRFYRGPETASSGSGLGLAIAHEVVLLHGGTLNLDSGPHGRGLAVIVSLKADSYGKLSQEAAGTPV